MLEIVPSAALPPETPFTLQTTARSGLPEPVTLALNVCAAPVATFAEFGEIVIKTSLLNMTFAEALFEGSPSLVAVTVTLPAGGRICGAVYRPAFEIVPAVALPPAMPSTLQVTAVSLVPVTSAVKDCIPPRKIVALDGVTLTLMMAGGGGDDDPPVLPHPASSKARAPATAHSHWRASHFPPTPCLSSIALGAQALCVPT